VTVNNVLNQARRELDAISQHINVCASCSTCCAQEPIDTLRVLIDVIEQMTHRNPTKYVLVGAIVSGLGINTTASGPTPPSVVLDELMKAQGLSNKRLAAQCGVTPKTINDLRAGHTRPTPRMALALENAGLSTAEQWNQLTARYKDWLLRQQNGNT
jgi:plasmid maintenance system antidote protein VapI